MCLIIAKPAGVKVPPEAHFRIGYKNNGDGLGLAYWKSDNTNGLVTIKKDFDTIDQMITFINDNIGKDDLLIVHFRLATHGLKDKGNRHPFPITDNSGLMRELELESRMVVAHNGIISQYNDHKKYSDTQKFVMDILGDPVIMNNIRNSTIQKLIIEYVGRDKLAIGIGNGDLLLLGEYEKDGGCFYSNTGYKVDRTYLYQRHWNGSYDVNAYNKSYSITDKRENAKPFEDTCEGCGGLKKVMDVKYKDQFFLLCKACRKKAKKGKLALVQEQCACCSDWKDETEMVDMYQDKVCKDCKRQLTTEEIKRNIIDNAVEEVDEVQIGNDKEPKGENDTAPVGMDEDYEDGYGNKWKARLMKGF
jgi:hypothetical protein